MDGRFTISGVNKGETLRVTYVGYQPKEVVWNGSALNITLQEDNQTLGDVVVVGYATQKKVNVTGAVSMVDSKVLEARPVQNVAQALQGEIPGLQFSVGNGGGALGSQMGVSIRGGGTIGTGSSGAPLVLIDGIEGDMNALNPNDIASVSVLKDAASSSIYGARAAFGVILITTKSGKAGKTSVSYSGNFRYNSPIQIPEMVSSIDFARAFNEAQVNNNGVAIFNEETMQKMRDYIDGKFTDPTKPEYYGTDYRDDGWWLVYDGPAFANTNWFKEFYKSAVPSQEHNVSISGGGDKMTYVISGAILNQNGLLRHGKDEFKRYNFNSRFAIKPASWVTVNVTNKFIRENYNRPQYIENGGLFYHNIARRWPNNPVKIFGHNTPWMEMDELEQGGTVDNTKNTIVNQVQAVFEPLKDWHITVDGSLTQTYTTWRKNVLPVYSYDSKGEAVAQNNGDYSAGFTSAEERRESQDYFVLNIYSDYEHTFGKHYFKVLGGMNTELWKGGRLNGSGENLITTAVPYVSATQRNFKTSNSIAELALAGFFGRVNYNYDEKYLFEANLRYDGSSRFIGDKRWGLFPSFSAGWNMARESFFTPLSKYISTLKLRASWGRLGNNALDSWYPFFQNMGTGSLNSGWLLADGKQNTAWMPGIVSSALTWETIESWDVGLDWTALNGRLTGTFGVYNRYTYDMVGPAPTLPAILGTGVPRVNNADLKSYGWELEVSWRDRIGEVGYGARFNISDTQRKILRYPNETGSLSTYYAGMKLGQIWGYTTVGIAQTQEQMDAHLQNNNPNWGSNWTAGDVMYADLNGDHEVTSGASTLNDHGDLRIIGNSTPRYQFGLNLTADWKGIDFSLFLQGVMKRDYAFGAGDPYFWGLVDGMWQSAVFKEHLDYWTKDNPNAYYPRPVFGSGSKNQQVQTRYLQSAAYMRVKNIQLGYTLPQSWTQKAYLQKVRLYISADNLLTFTSMAKQYDPEALGGDWGSGKLYPLQKSVSFGINVTL